MKSEPQNTPSASEEFYKKLIAEGPLVPGDDGAFLEGNQIKWLNPKLVKEGQEFVRRHSFVLNLAHTAALLFGFSFKNLTTVLLRTGKFSGVNNSMTRYIETEQHILQWYESDILAEQGIGFKDIQRVRKMHASALRKSLQSPVKLFENVSGKLEKEEFIRAIKRDLTCFATPDSPLDLISYKPPVLMSQFDMAMTQYGFVGLVVLFPDILGIKDTTGMEGFIHLWAVIGRLVGIQDRFNLALHGDRELFEKIFKTIGMASLMECDLTAVVLQESFSQATAKLLGFTSLKSMFYFALKGAGKLEPKFTGENIYNTMNWLDKFFLGVMQLTFFLVYHLDFFRVGINNTMRVVQRFNHRRILGVKGKSRKATTDVFKNKSKFNQVA